MGVFMEEENVKKDSTQKILEQIEEQKEIIAEEGIDSENIKYLSLLVDVCKDFKEMEANDMMYRTSGYGNYNAGGNYGNYNESNSYGRRGRDSRGRYTENGSFGRRGVDSRYQGDESMEEMYQNYREYSEGREMYGNDSKTMESFEYMLKSMKDFYKHLMKEASTQEEMQMLQQTIQEMAQM